MAEPCQAARAAPQLAVDIAQRRDILGREADAVEQRDLTRTLHTMNGNRDVVADIPVSNPFDRALCEVRMIDGVANSEASLPLGTV